MRRVTPENKVSRRKLPSVSIIHILEKGKIEDQNLWEAKLCSSLLHTLSSRKPCTFPAMLPLSHHYEALQTFAKSFSIRNCYIQYIQERQTTPAINAPPLPAALQPMHAINYTAHGGAAAGAAVPRRHRPDVNKPKPLRGRWLRFSRERASKSKFLPALLAASQK